MYRLEYSERAKKEIQSLPSQKIKDQIEEAILRLADHPDLGKNLKGGLAGLWAYRSGDYRIIYKLFKSELRILIIALGHRRDIYRGI